MFGPKILAEYPSAYSGSLRVVKGLGGYKYVATGMLTQTGGIINDLWSPVVKRLAKSHAQPQTFLILGLAAGTLAQMLAKKLHPQRIVGVEIDPVMIEIGRKYFNLADISQLETVVADAKKYIASTKEYFDCIFVDMYLGDTCPAFVYERSFIRQLSQHGKLVILNHLFYDDAKKAKAEKLLTELKAVFADIQIVHSLTNILILCSDPV